MVSEEEEEFSEPAWIPSLDVGFEGYSYDVETTIVNLSDPSSWSETQPESVNQLVFRIGGELMGPMFENLPGRPRLFVQGGAGLNAYSGTASSRSAIPTTPTSRRPVSTFTDTRIGGPPGAKIFPSTSRGKGVGSTRISRIRRGTPGWGLRSVCRPPAECCSTSNPRFSTAWKRSTSRES